MMTTAVNAQADFKGAEFHDYTEQVGRDVGPAGEFSASGAASQAMFEAMFDHTPKVDLTRPARKAPSAEVRATWRKKATA
jgi:hypothetical protein